MPPQLPLVPNITQPITSPVQQHDPQDMRPSNKRPAQVCVLQPAAKRSATLEAMPAELGEYIG